MKWAQVIIAAFGASFACASVIPDISTNSSLVPELKPRADNKWELVIYDDYTSDKQCGGTSITVTGSKGEGSCINTSKTTSCVNISIKNGWPTCDFSWKKDSCNDGVESTITVTKGKDIIGQELNKVHFVSVQ